MNSTEIEIFQKIVESTHAALPLEELANVSARSIERATSSLESKGLLRVQDGQVSLAETAKASMAGKIARRYDISKLWLGAGEEILPFLAEPRSIAQLQKLANLSVATTYRTLDRMMQSGAVVKNERREYSTNPNDEILRLFATLLREELESKRGGPRKNVETLYTDGVLAIIAVKKGHIEKDASFTAFSVFSEFGMDLRPERDYYIIPGMKVGVEDALVHAIVASKNKIERTHCAVFYAINRAKLDIEKVRRESDRFRVASLWLNLERLVLGLTVSQGLFLNWEEFAERCRLYGVDPLGLQPPRAHPMLFEKIGRSFGPREALDVYLIGGENMRIKKMKQSTKDVDLVVKNRKAYSRLARALEDLGYRSLARTEMTQHDRKLDPSGIFVLENSPRVDVFTGVICNKMHLTESMMENSETQRFGALALHLLSNEDVFLLKTITDREADDVDMLEIVKSSKGFDWQHVFDTLMEQEKITAKHYCFAVLESLDLVRESLQVKIPIYRSLLVHTTDEAILRALGRTKSWVSVRELRERIGEIGESELRNRLHALCSRHQILKKKSSGTLLFKK